MVDDWSERLRSLDPSTFSRIDPDLLTIIAKSCRHFALDASMAMACAARYGSY